MKVVNKKVGTRITYSGEIIKIEPIEESVIVEVKWKRVVKNIEVWTSFIIFIVYAALSVNSHTYLGSRFFSFVSGIHFVIAFIKIYKV